MTPTARSAVPRVFEGVHCVLSIVRAARGVVVVTFRGTDVGEFGSAPLDELDRLVGEIPIELYIDARAAKSASVDVSGDWSQWLSRNRPRLRHVSMLTGSRFIQLSADVVRRFADLGDAMRLYTEAAAFEGALKASVEQANAG